MDPIVAEQDKKKKKRIIIIVLILLLLLLLLISFLVLHKKEYEITFDTNGGSEIASVKVKENDKIQAPEDPTKEGYVFAGWYYQDELYDFNTPVKCDMTLKAEWFEDGDAEVEGVELNATQLSIAPDGTAELIATLLPENAKYVKLIWSSSDESIATVDENGNIKALREGTVTVTVTTEDGKYTASCTVTVTKDIVSVEGVSISGANEVGVGKSIKLTATVRPDNASNKAVTWSCSNPSIARVDANGTVRGLKEGTVTITVTTEDGGYKATYTVKVTANATTSNNNTNNNNSSSNNSSSNNNKPATNPPATNKPNPPATNNPPSSNPQKKDTYSITITRQKQKVTGNLMQYTYVVYKNGTAFSGYLGFTCGGASVMAGEKSIQKTELKNESSTAQITLSDGSTVSASVSYIDKEVEN